MIDVHTHVLPCVDDGSALVETSLKMLKKEVKSGVSKLILTPHFRHGMFNDFSSCEIRRRFEDFKSACKEAKIKADLYLGQEIYCTHRIYDDLQSGNVITINGTEYILIEFSYYDETYIGDYVFKIERLGFKPVIAHVERYTYLDFNNLYDYRQAGALIQVNASSVVGDEGKATQQRVLSAISAGLVDFVASDYHSGRTFSMKKAAQIVMKTCGRQTAENLFRLNAEKYFNL